MYFFPPTVVVGEPHVLFSVLPDEVFDCVIWEMFADVTPVSRQLLSEHPLGDVLWQVRKTLKGGIPFFYRWLVPYAADVRRVLIDVGTCAVIGQPSLMPYTRLALDPIFGMKNFANEIIWAFSRKMRPAKQWEAWHNTIYLYAKQVDKQYINLEGIDRLSVRMTTKYRRLFRRRGPEYAEIGRAPSDVWLLPLPRRKAAKFKKHGRSMLLYKRLIQAHSVPGSMVLSLFDVTGLSLRSAIELGRSCILVLPKEFYLNAILEEIQDLNVRVIYSEKQADFAASFRL